MENFNKPDKNIFKIPDVSMLENLDSIEPPSFLNKSVSPINRSGISSRSRNQSVIDDGGSKISDASFVTAQSGPPFATFIQKNNNQTLPVIKPSAFTNSFGASSDHSTTWSPNVHSTALSQLLTNVSTNATQGSPGLLPDLPDNLKNPSLDINENSSLYRMMGSTPTTIEHSESSGISSGFTSESNGSISEFSNESKAQSAENSSKPTGTKRDRSPSFIPIQGVKNRESLKFSPIRSRLKFFQNSETGLNKTEPVTQPPVKKFFINTSPPTRLAPKLENPEAKVGPKENETSKVGIESKVLEIEAQNIENGAFNMEFETKNLEIETFKMENETRNMEIETNKMENETRNMEIETNKMENETRNMEIETNKMKNEIMNMEIETNKMENEIINIQKAKIEVKTNRTSIVKSKTGATHLEIGTSKMKSETPNVKNETQSMNLSKNVVEIPNETQTVPKTPSTSAVKIKKRVDSPTALKSPQYLRGFGDGKFLRSKSKSPRTVFVTETSSRILSPVKNADEDLQKSPTTPATVKKAPIKTPVSGKRAPLVTEDKPSSVKKFKFQPKHLLTPKVVKKSASTAKKPPNIGTGDVKQNSLKPNQMLNTRCVKTTPRQKPLASRIPVSITKKHQGSMSVQKSLGEYKGNVGKTNLKTAAPRNLDFNQNDMKEKAIKASPKPPVAVIKKSETIGMSNKEKVPLPSRIPRYIPLYKLEMARARKLAQEQAKN